MKGYKHTPEAKEKIRKSKLGSKNPNFGKFRFVPDEERKKISERQMGPKNHMFGRHLTEAEKEIRRNFRHSLDARQRISAALSLRRGEKHPLFGKPVPLERRLKQSASMMGKNSKGGITPINNRIRQSIEYRLWREAVFARDNYTCVLCFKRGVELNADHIKRFSLFPELRFAIDNGRTLCISCHKKTATYGSRGLKMKQV